jgi:hypothetical protein
MKLKKPVYLEGIDYADAYLTSGEADELLETMKSQPFADTARKCTPPLIRATLGRTATLGQRISSPSPHSSSPCE